MNMKSKILIGLAALVITNVASANCKLTINAQMPIKPTWVNPEAETQDYVDMWDQDGDFLGSFTDKNGDGYAEVNYTYNRCDGQKYVSKVQFQRRIYQPYMGNDNNYGNWGTYVWTHTAGGHRGSRTGFYHVDYYGNSANVGYVSPMDNFTSSNPWYWQTNWWATAQYANESYCPHRTNPQLAYVCTNVTYLPLTVNGSTPVPTPTPVPVPTANTCAEYANSVDRGFFYYSAYSAWIKVGDYQSYCNARTPIGGMDSGSGFNFSCVNIGNQAYWICNERY